MPDINDSTVVLGRREYDRQLNLIDKKIDDLTTSMAEMSKTLQQLAIQNYQIQTLQSMQNEMRGDINSLEEKTQKLIGHSVSYSVDFKALKANVTILWGFCTTALLGILGAYISHMISGGGK
jgi:hypothetical protein